MIARLLPVALAKDAERDDGLRKRWSNVVLSSWLSILLELWESFASSGPKGL